MSKNNKLKIIVETKSLIHALTFANSIVEKRNVIAELSNIKLSAQHNILELVATDMDIYLSQKIGVQILNEGEITVSTKILTDIVRKIPDQEITLAVTNETNQLDIFGKNCHFSLLTLPAHQFPMMNEIKAESMLKIPCRDFVKILDYTQFSVSTEETRYNLNGIYLHIRNGAFYAASTDGHRLSVSSVLLNDQVEEFGVILPRKTVDEILKIVKDSKNIQSDIEIWLSLNKIKFICNRIVMVSKLIDGIFPNYIDFIPLENNYKLIINTKMFADTIDRVATITIDKFRAIKIILTKDAIEITASGESIGIAKEIIICSKEQENLCEFEHNNILSIGFNPKYLMDILSVIKFNQIELYFSDASSPILIKVTESPQDIFVVMPVKV